MLYINDLTYRIGGRMLFENATMAIDGGQKVGLVGRNGSGKSTLFRLIAHEIEADSGSITLINGKRRGQMAQEAPDGPLSLLDTVLAADAERANLLHHADHETDGMKLAEIHTRLNEISAHSAPARAARILAGLGFDTAAQARPVGEFSGGWRMRVALAAVLFAEPDVLLLDEPSNHLDFEARVWLENYLKYYRNTLVLISHDRELLNAVVDRIVHIDDKKLISYGGNYDRFERTRREQQALLVATQAKQIAQRAHMQAFVDRFRAKASKARQAQSRIKMLEKMEPIVVISPESAVRFSFPEPQQLPSPLIVLEHAAVGYAAGKPILQRLDLRLDMDDRIALLGANGNGKTTMMRLLSGRLPVQAGEMRKPGKLRVGYFAQNQLEELDAEATALVQMARLMPGVVEQKLRQHLGRFGFSRERAELTIANLSGGEKTRLAMAAISSQSPQLLLLDEPTNHLDMDARAALIEAINDFDGAVMLVSHDPHLIRLIADRLWVVRNGTCAPFEGDVDAYEKSLDTEGDGGRGENGSNGEAKRSENKREKRRAAAEARARLAPLRKTIAEAEKRLEKLRAERQVLATTLQDPELYSGQTDRFTKLNKELAELDRKIGRCEQQWFDAQAACEAAGGTLDAEDAA